MTGKPIGLGVAGLGRAFTLMLPTFMQDPRIRLVAGADPRPGARDMFQRDFGTAFDTLELLCADPAVEMVYIATPHQLHIEHVEIAARHGKPMLVEKPLAITLEDCHRIVELVEASGTPLIVGHSHSFDGPVLQAARLLGTGSLGPVRMIHAMNYTDFLYRPRRPEELDTRQGGGVVFSQGAHQVDIVRMLGGGLVRTVQAHTGAWDAARPTEGAYSALLGFEGGACASLTYSGYAHYDSDELMGGVGEMGWPKPQDAYGAARRKLSRSSPQEEARQKAAGNFGGEDFRGVATQPAPYHQHFGHILVSAQEADLKLTPQGLIVYGHETRVEHTLPAPEVPRSEVVDEMWRVVRDGLAPVHDARWARANMEVCLAILEAARSGSVVALRHQVPLLQPEPDFQRVQTPS